MNKIISLNGKIYKIQKYIIDNEGQESVWCNDWYGKHVIGQDCEWYIEPIIKLCKLYLSYGYQNLFDNRGEHMIKEFRRDCKQEIKNLLK